MTIEATLERVTAIRQALADPAIMIGSDGSLTGGTQAPTAAPGTGESSFAAELQRASGGLEGTAAGPPTTATAAYMPPSANGVAGAQALSSMGVAGVAGLSSTGLAVQDSPGARMVAIAESQIGQSEQPPGSNESPAIAQYRSATAGAVPGAPWCAYFASWVARQAGEPIGEGGQGAGAVADVWSWAQSTGRAIPNGPGVVPKPGDLIVFGDEHVGIVRDVLPSGQIQTIEGNYENKVAANVRSPTEATGYVEMN